MIIRGLIQCHPLIRWENSSREAGISTLDTVDFAFIFKGAIKSHHMFILSYVTFYFRFCDANILLHSAVLISEHTFSFHLQGHPHVQNHVSGKEN